ncbi:hypothetical protein B5X24_HaOG206857 [Helicoverpa armigera]|uniref:Uncharacterized protein n=1 Tax=Helicoverpa armigera TaxID=29058 RepID=A0A2W1BQ23_HELAM|nr:hypothetical protein B5X24_HaOG206857 [Helicoverpa armigera]
MKLSVLYIQAVGVGPLDLVLETTLAPRQAISPHHHRLDRETPHTLLAMYEHTELSLVKHSDVYRTTLGAVRCPRSVSDARLQSRLPISRTSSSTLHKDA